MNLAALIASAYLFTFSAPATVPRPAVAEIVRSAARSLGCEEPSVEFDLTNQYAASWQGTVRCRRWQEPKEPTTP